MRSVATGFILILVVIGAGSCRPTPPARDVKQYSIEQFYKNEQIGGGVFSPDGRKLLAHSNVSGIYNLYEITIADGARRQLTHSTKESIFAIDYVDNDNLLYSSDKGGNEIDHIYLLKKDGSTQDLTPGEKEVASFAGWNRDRTLLYYRSNRRNPKFFDLYAMRVADWSSTMIYTNDQGYEVSDVSSDNAWIALQAPKTSSENDLLLYNVENRKLLEVSDPAAPASYSASGFSLDGKTMYYITNAGKEYQYLVRYDIASGTRTTVFEPRWDVMYSYASEHERYRVTATNEDGLNVLKVTDIRSGKDVELPAIPDGDVLSVSISRDEAAMRLSVGTSKSPADMYVYTFASKELKKLTNTLNREINPEDLVAAEVVRFKSFDGLDIPAIYYKPHQASEKKPTPGLVWVHGGPGGQSRVGFSELIQYLVNHGYAVLAVNNRGSSGYGRSFNKMDDRNHGDKDLKDCIHGKKYLESLPYIAKNKIGIIGGSYGGFMTMAAMTSTPDEFAVGVDLFGVTNWLRTLRSIPPYWESFRKALYAEMGDPTTADSVRLRQISPLFHAENIRHPVMVLQGANDPRVLKAESDEIVDAARKHNVPTEYVVFPDEGHGFVKKENQIKGYSAVRAFLDKYLR
jgi:dipeptidyl aminopeptidase/acylaminoacyl peptidase